MSIGEFMALVEKIRVVGNLSRNNKVRP